MNLTWDHLVLRLSRFDKTRGGCYYWPLVVGGMLTPHTLQAPSSQVNHRDKRLLSSYKYQEYPSRASMPEQRKYMVCLVSISRRSPKNGARIRTTSLCLLYLTFCVVGSTHTHAYTHTMCVYMIVSVCKCIMYHFHLKVYKHTHKTLISRSTIGKMTGP